MNRFRLALLSLLLSRLLLPAALCAQELGSLAQFSLKPGDVLKVLVWREEQMSGDFRVDESGRLILPLIGMRKVTDIPWPVLHDSLLDAYTRQLKNPSVTLTPLRRVYVLGEVTKPGMILIDPTLGFAGAVAMAGGANLQGDLRRIRVVREGHTVIKRTSVDSLIVGAQLQSGDQIFVDRLSWFDRNSQFVASAAISVAGILISLISR